MKLQLLNKQKNINFFGAFRQKEREERYFKYARNKSTDFVRIAILFFGVVFFLIAIFDYGYNEYSDFVRSLIVRSSVLLISLALFIALKYIKTSRLYYASVMLFPILLTSSYIYILAMQKAQGLAYQSIAIIIVLFSVTILPFLWIHVFAINTFISVFFIALSRTYIVNTRLTDYIEIAIYLFIVVLFTSMIKRKENINRREGYLWENQLRVQSTVDTLTGCYNRLWIDTKMEEFSLFRDSDPNSHFSLIMFDIDNFKKVNDAYGHLAGDKILVECSSLVRTYIRPSDYYARWGGEEFIILLPLKTLDEGYRIAERIRRGIEEHTFSTGSHITCSFGVAASRPQESAESLVRRADDMLYLAKRNGKNRVEKDTSVPALLTSGAEIA